MKKVRYILKTLLVLLTFCFCSCSDLEDTYSHFLKGGEIVYSTKIDSAHFYPGDNRIQIKCFLKNAIQVKNIIFSWEDQEKKEIVKKIPYDYTTTPDSVLVELEMPEGQHVVIVTSENETGNLSIPFQNGVKIYGDQYRSYLTNRSISALQKEGASSVRISFRSIVTNMVSTKVIYKTTDGKSKAVAVPVTDDTVLLEDCDLSKPGSYTSGYLPEKNAIDTLYCAPSALSFSELE